MHSSLAPTPRAQRARAAAAIGAVLCLAGLLPTGPLDHAEAGAPRVIVFNGEGNRLNAYDGRTGEKQTVIPSAAEGGLDINAQICFREMGGRTFFIAGEDSFQDTEDDVEGKAGWGWFELVGDDVGELSAVQRGKLVPTYSGEEQPENYGCGFLPDGRLVTTDVGDQLPHQAASGQLIVWFPGPASGFEDATGADADPRTIDNSLDSRYCKVDTSMGTAGGVWVADGWVYVAVTRPGPNGPGGVYRYEIADLPTDAGCGGHDREQPLAAAGVVTRELWLASDEHALTPSGIVPSGRTVGDRPTWYVSSVFNGVIAEYLDLGPTRVHVRNLVEPPAGTPLGQFDDAPRNGGGTPFGLGVTPDGEVWYADLGIRGPGPADDAGSVQRVDVDSQGAVRARFAADEGLDFPDGIGILVVGGPQGASAGRFPDRGDAEASSEWPCEWGMYGQGPARQFAVADDCRSPIAPSSAASLVPAWTVKTDKAVTASPAVAGGSLYVGDWGGTMYAVDSESGEVRWRFDTADSPGAAFGPIVSSAALARVPAGGDRTLVVFGAGPRVYALDSADGRVAWERVLDDRPGTPVQVESSPVVWKGIVYVGLDNHNQDGTGVRGGLLALDAATGSVLWKFEPELVTGDRGCGGVWSSPTLDTAAERPLVFFATANCPDDDAPWTPHTEAVTALDARSGEPVWTFQPHLRNDRDWDFGATANLFRDPTGRAVLGIGSKDGAYFALAPADGRLLWSTKAAEPGDVDEGFSIGGFIGSTATYGGHVFGGTALGGPPYYHSLDGTSGALRWRGAQAPSYAASAAVNGVVFAGALDDVFRAYDAATGAVLWAAPLLGPISSGPAVVADSVYVGSGTSSSDACAKERPGAEACFAVFDDALGRTGGIHAFRLAVGAAGGPPARGPEQPAPGGTPPEVQGGQQPPSPGGALAATGVAVTLLGATGWALVAVGWPLHRAALRSPGHRRSRA